jgi:hypothetical protein
MGGAFSAKADGLQTRLVFFHHHHASTELVEFLR